MKSRSLIQIIATCSALLMAAACSPKGNAPPAPSGALGPQLSVPPINSGSQVSSEGGSDRGGGNALGSSAEQVEFELNQAMLDFGEIVHYGAIDTTNVLNPRNVKDPRVRSILNSWFATERSDSSSEKIVSDSLNTKYRLQRGDCPSDTDNDHDASTQHKLGAEICFSSNRLIRFPQWTLRGELISLAAHEFAHHFGFSEVEARAVQTYVFNAYGLIQVQLKLAEFYSMDLSNYRSRVTSGYSPAGSPVAKSFAKRICRQEASIEGLASGLNLAWFQRDLTIRDACDPDQFDADSVEKQLRVLEEKSIQDFNE